MKNDKYIQAISETMPDEAAKQRMLKKILDHRQLYENNNENERQDMAGINRNEPAQPTRRDKYRSYPRMKVSNILAGAAVFAIIILGLFTIIVASGEKGASLDDAGISELPPEIDNTTELFPANAPNVPEISAEEASAPTVDYITIKGERYSTSLTELKLDSSGLTNTDIEPLKYMTNLTTLSLSVESWFSYKDSSSVSDISPLSGLTNLVWLDLCFNSISDISPLSELTNLTDLMLNNNQIEDISPLSGLTSLTYLNLSGNPAGDISALSGLKNLTVLVLIGNEISDISPLSGLSNLTELCLEQNEISDISPLSGLINLTFVGLTDNDISDWAPVLHVDVVDGRP